MADTKIFSFYEREIKIENIHDEMAINIFLKKGLPSSVKINKDYKLSKSKNKVEFLKEHSEFFKAKVLKDLKFASLIKSLKKEMFSADAILYGFFNDLDFYIYDIFTNTNYFSFCDLEKICYEWGYETIGLHLMKPILSGYKTKEEVITFLGNMMIENNNKLSDYFIIPYYPEVSSTTYNFYDTPKVPSDSEEEIIFEEPEVIIEPENVPSLDFVPEFIEEAENNYPTLEQMNFRLAQENDKIKNKSMFKKNILPGSLPAFNNALEVIKDHIDWNKVVLNKDEYDLIEIIAFLWSMWGTSSTLAIVNTHINNFLKRPESKNLTPLKSMPFVFYEIWTTKEADIINYCKSKKAFTPTLLEKILDDEFYYLNQALETSFRKGY